MLGWLATAGCADPDDRPASFGYIHTTILLPSCATANCHSELSTTAGLRFDSIEGAYLSLTGTVCDSSDPTGAPPRLFVDPGSPETSQLIYQLRGIERRRMPPDTPLPEAEIQLVEQWILEGAACN